MSRNPYDRRQKTSPWTLLGFIVAGALMAVGGVMARSPGLLILAALALTVCAVSTRGSAARERNAADYSRKRNQ